MSAMYNGMSQQFYGAPQYTLMNNGGLISTGVPMVSGALAPQVAMGVPLSQYSVPQQSYTTMPAKLSSPLAGGSVTQGWNGVFPATVPSSGMAVSQGPLQTMGGWSVQKPASPVYTPQMQPNAMSGAWAGMPYGVAQGIPAYQQTNFTKPQTPVNPYAVQGAQYPNYPSVHKPNPAAAMPASPVGHGAPGAVQRRTYQNGALVPAGHKSKRSGAEDAALVAGVGGLSVLALAAALICPPIALLALPAVAVAAAASC